MSQPHRLDKISAAAAGKISTRLGVRNKSKRVQLNKEILNTLHDNKDNINDMFKAALKDNPIKGLELMLQMMSIVFKEEK